MPKMEDGSFETNPMEFTEKGFFNANKHVVEETWKYGMSKEQPPEVVMNDELIVGLYPEYRRFEGEQWVRLSDYQRFLESEKRLAVERFAEKVKDIPIDIESSSNFLGGIAGYQIDRLLREDYGE